MTTGEEIEEALGTKKTLKVTEEESRIIQHLRKHGYVPRDGSVKSERATKALKLELKQTKELYEETLKELEVAEERCGIVESITNPRAAFHYKLPKKNKTAQLAAIMVASDWHLEERVDPSTVGGANRFTPDIAARRVGKFFKRGLFMINWARTGMEVDTLILALLGDMITGYIHEELVEDNYLSPTQALIRGSELICSGIDFLLAEGKFKKIVIPCCYGNHGRTTMKPRIGTGYKNSYEWLMYQQLAAKYKNEPRLQFVIANGYHVWVDVFGFPIRFHHGDAIKYGGGVGGPTIPIMKKLSRWDRKRQAYLDVFGHLHEYIDHNRFVMNGSLIGYTAFGERIGGEFMVPQQALITIDSRFGKSLTAPIYLEDPKQGRSKDVSAKS